MQHGAALRIANRSRHRFRARMVWSTSNCAIGLHCLRGNSLRQRCYYVADLGSPCAVIDLVCAARNVSSNWIRTNSCSLISPHRPIYRHHLSWLTLELDFRNGWDHHSAVSEPMAPEKTKTSRLVSFVLGFRVRRTREPLRIAIVLDMV